MGHYLKFQRTGIMTTTAEIDGVQFDVEFCYDDESEYGVSIETARLQGRNWLEHLNDDDVSCLAAQIAGVGLDYRETA